MVMGPLWVFLWTLDDLMFSAYRKVALVDPIFLVGGFRTGSTSLHRAMSLDSSRYCSPRFVELALPFLTVHFFLDFLEFLDGKFGSSFIAKIENKFQSILGKECMARHPMAFYEPEEDDILHAAWHWTGWYIGTMFPDADAWIASGQQQKSYSSAEQDKMYTFYERSLQKVLYRRGNGRALLSKSHLIEFMFTLERKIPSAKFVGTVRNPKDTFVSWYALAQAASKVMGAGWNLPTDVATAAHLRFWDLFTASEMAFFNDDGSNCNKILIPFSSYIENQEGCLRTIYKKFKLSIDDDFEQKLKEDAERHQNYKAKRGYENPTLEDLGTSAKHIEKRMEAYTKEFQLDVKTK